MAVVYIDLSAKVEQWERDSAIAVCNDVTRLLLNSGRVKQQIRHLIIERHGRTTVQYRALALMIYLAVQPDLAHIRQIVIDQDYSGAMAEGTIKNLLLHLLRRDKPNVTTGFIRFETVKGSRADRLAREVFQRKRPPDRTVTYEELEALFRK